MKIKIQEVDFSVGERYFLVLHRPIKRVFDAFSVGEQPFFENLHIRKNLVKL